MKDRRTYLRRRVGGYKGQYWTLMLETDFKSIFSKVQKELGLKQKELFKTNRSKVK